MTDLETRVRAIVEDDLGLRDVRPSDDLVNDHGVDELGLMSVAMRLEEEFGLDERSVSEEALIFESTVTKCVELVTRASRPEPYESAQTMPMMLRA
jgi:acyl carrier protein